MSQSLLPAAFERIFAAIVFRGVRVPATAPRAFDPFTGDEMFARRRGGSALIGIAKAMPLQLMPALSELCKVPSLALCALRLTAQVCAGAN